jgi:hypothetical protein
MLFLRFTIQCLGLLPAKMFLFAGDHALETSVQG